MGANLRVRSCRYMPPEDYEDFGEHRGGPASAVGARSYSNISRRFMKISGAALPTRSFGPVATLKSFFSRLGLFR